jgi:precorrin-3B synthase
MSSRRRGACPGLSAPMPTGDGLLVRLYPIGTMPLAACAELCRAARRHGNGVIEITSRGSIQVRGLSDESAPQFAAEIAALGIAADDGVPVLCNPLAGIDAEEIFDSLSLAAELRGALARSRLQSKLSAKVSIAIDGGGALGLAELPADIRLTAQAENGTPALRLAFGGNDTGAAPLGIVAAKDAVEAVMRLLEVLAARGSDSRARDIVAGDGIALFHSAIADLLASAYPRDGGRPDPSPRLGGDERNRQDAIGSFYLRNGSLALGIGFAFGQTDASALLRLIDAAEAAGASGFRAAPGRVLMTIGLSPQDVPGFVAAAGQLGFIVRADDPRRSVVACAGAPICAFAHIAARALAPVVAERLSPHSDGAVTVHISGCAKGCAQAAPATLTVVGTPGGCALVAGGAASDTPFALVATNELPMAIARFAREQNEEAAHV